MNDKIRDHVRAYNEKCGYANQTEQDIIDTIRDADEVWSGNDSNRRWWTECFTVVNVDGMLIGFDDAKTTGDDSPRDKGWEFDPSSICEVVAKEVTKTVYKRK